MRTLQLIILALLAMAARADVQPCVLTFLGSGVTCTEGLLTFTLTSSAPPDTIVEPILGGLALVGEMDGGGGGTSVILSVTVPQYTKIVGSGTVALTEDILTGGFDTGMAISAVASGPSGAGLLLSDINSPQYLAPCLGCGTVSNLPVIGDALGEFHFGMGGDDINNVGIHASTYGGPAIVER